MYISASQKRIGSAVLVGAAVIAVALYIRGTEHNPISAQGTTDGDIIVTTAPKRTAIAVSDSNKDGVPDWQESLITTTPLDVAEPITDSTYTPPDTLTEKFSEQFFENMMRNKSAGDFGAQTGTLIQNATQSLAQDAVDTLYTAADIRTQPNNDPAMLSTYGEAIARILQNQDDTTGENEAAILNRAIANSDPQELAKLDVKIAIYKNVVEQTKALAAPSSAAKQHLDLLNTYQAILNDIIAMRSAFDDPMRALLRVKRYEDDAQGLKYAIENLYTVLYDQGARWDSGSAVYALIRIE